MIELDLILGYIERKHGAKVAMRCLGPVSDIIHDEEPADIDSVAAEALRCACGDISQTSTLVETCGKIYEEVK